MSHQANIRRFAPPPAFRMAIAGVAAVVSLAALSCKRAAAPGALPPIPTVTVAMVVQKDVPIYEESVGTTVGFVNANILPKVSGYLLKQDYQDGSRVHAGQLLFEIDPRQYQAALDQALGNLAQAQAQLKQNQQDLARYTELFNAAVIPKQKFDNATQTTRASAAQVQADTAAVESAKLNLQWTKVYSPINGVAGIAQAQVGDLVGTSTLLTTVSQVDPIKVSFPVSEKLYLHFAGPINASGGANAKSPPPTSTDSRQRLRLQLPGAPLRRQPAGRCADRHDNDAGYLSQSREHSPSRDVRQSARADRRSAQRAARSSDRRLFDSRAIRGCGGRRRQQGDARTVTPGIKTGSLWVIDGGLKPGERVIAEGAQKVQEGMEVRPCPRN